jgi:hypothetical protein
VLLPVPPFIPSNTTTVEFFMDGIIEWFTYACIYLHRCIAERFINRQGRLADVHCSGSGGISGHAIRPPCLPAIGYAGSAPARDGFLHHDGRSVGTYLARSVSLRRRRPSAEQRGQRQHQRGFW